MYLGLNRRPKGRNVLLMMIELAGPKQTSHLRLATESNCKSVSIKLYSIQSIQICVVYNTQIMVEFFPISERERERERERAAAAAAGNMSHDRYQIT